MTDFSIDYGAVPHDEWNTVRDRICEQIRRGMTTEQVLDSIDAEYADRKVDFGRWDQVTSWIFDGGDDAYELAVIHGEKVRKGIIPAPDAAVVSIKGLYDQKIRTQYQNHHGLPAESIH